MKRPTTEDVKQSLKAGASYAKEHGEPIARQAVESGRAALKTKTGRRIAKGALAGGAIAYAIPFMAISTGVILGAGAMLFLKSATDKED